MSESQADSTRKLRQALGTFATGVTVVTTMDGDGQPRGFTANSFTSVSLDPPLILVCLSKEAATYPVFESAGRFCVNILAEDQQDVSHLFSSPEHDRFDQVKWRQGTHDCPIVDGVISWFECEMHEVTDAGDHIILIGRILDHDSNGRSPLVYCGGSYVEFGLVQRAMESADEGFATRVAAVINCGGQIPLERIAGSLSLPAAERVGNPADEESLVGRLATAGITVDIPFVCAVYEDAKSSTHNVVYRGTGVAADTSGYELVGMNEIPWDELVDNPTRILLQRFVEESERDAFGVYVGDSVAGAVHALV